MIGCVLCGRPVLDHGYGDLVACLEQLSSLVLFGDDDGFRDWVDVELGPSWAGAL